MSFTHFPRVVREIQMDDNVRFDTNISWDITTRPLTGWAGHQEPARNNATTDFIFPDGMPLGDIPIHFRADTSEFLNSGSTICLWSR